MPQKTRKEKLLAQQRRTSRASSFSFSVPPRSQEEERAVHYSLPSAPSVLHVPKTENDTVELSFIRHDIFMTVTLAAIAVGIELALYWRWELYR